MSWDKLAEQSGGIYTAADFERAGYRLITEQVVYATDAGSRGTYAMLRRYIDAFKALFDDLGIELVLREQEGYVVAIPRVEVAAKMPPSLARFALVLRKLYDDQAQTASLENREANASLQDIMDVYTETLHANQPTAKELRAWVKSLKRYGIAREVDAEDDQPFAVIVRPAIVDVLGEAALIRLATYVTPATDDAGDTEAEVESETDTNETA